MEYIYCFFLKFLTKKSFKYENKLHLSFNEKIVFVKINLITYEILNLKKLK